MRDSAEWGSDSEENEEYWAREVGDADVPQEDILAALKEAKFGEMIGRCVPYLGGFIAWIDVRAMYDRILSDR